MKKRILSLALCLLLLVTAFPAVAFADCSGYCGPDLYWTYTASTGKLSITGSGYMYGYNSVNAPWYSVRSSIKTISLASGVTSIGDYAFYGCSSVTTVTLPNSVTSIGDSSFDNCTALATAKLGSGVRSIDKWAFYRCYNLTSVTLPKAISSIQSFAFYRIDNLQHVYYEGSSANRASIYIGSPNNCLLDATWHYNATGSKPIIKTQPKAVSVTAGEKATFKVVASGATSYQWQYQKPGESSWTNVSSGGTSASYSLTTAAKHNGYKYRCRVKNSAGTVYTSAVKLTVKSKPIITTQPKAVTTIAGAKITFKVAATGATSYQWQYRAKDSSKWVNVKTKGTSAKYTLTTASRHNGYTYRVKITNAVGTVYSNAVKLTVKTPTAKPKITTQPKAVTVNAGEKATFKVVATDAATYQWQYQKKGSSKWVNVKSNATAASYSFNPTVNYTGYSYRCKVTNAKGSVYTKAAKLTVKAAKPKPTITTQPKSKVVDVGTKATFKVVASNATSYQWQYQKPGDSSWTDVKNGGTSASLSLTAEAKHNDYKYRCKVTNAGGSVYSSAVTLGVRRYIALLIGNGSGYVYQSTLNAGPYDLKVMKAMLTGMSPAYEVTTKENLTASEMVTAIKNTFKGTTKNDVCLFYYTGHGSNWTDSTAGALLGIYCSGGGSDMLYPSTLASTLSNACPGKVIVMLDSCGSGATIYSKGGSSNTANDAFTSAVVDAFRAQEQPASDDGLQATQKTGELRSSKFHVLAACAYGKTSAEYSMRYSGYSFSLFTYALGLSMGYSYPNGAYSGNLSGDKNNDKALTLGEAYNYVTEYVEYFRQNMSSGATQKTQVYGDSSFVLFRHK